MTSGPDQGWGTQNSVVCARLPNSLILRMAKKDTSSMTVYDLYVRMGLPLDCVKSKSGFTIHYLKETFKELPVTSIGYRPDYFSFLFVKDAHGKYTVDEMTFPIEPGMVCFTNPGNFRTFEWYAIND